MNFSDSQKKIFKKNLAAIKGSELEKKFKLIKKPKIKYFGPFFKGASPKNSPCILALIALI